MVYKLPFHILVNLQSVKTCEGDPVTSTIALAAYYFGSYDVESLQIGFEAHGLSQSAHVVS